MKINTQGTNVQAKTSVKKQETSKDENMLLQGTNDQAVITGEPKQEEMPLVKHKSFLRKGVEKTAGFAGGLVGSVLLAPAGTLEGMAEGTTSYKFSESGHASTGPLTTTALVGGALTGAAVAGFLTGWGSIVSGAIGAGVGLLTGGLALGLMDMADGDKKFTAAVDVAVDKAVADNPQGGSGAKKIANVLRNAGEGGTAGTIAGVKAGFDIGQSVGEGVASGVISLGTGIASGLGRIVTAPFRGKKETEETETPKE